MTLIPVGEARDMILRGVRPLAAERVPLAEALGRVLARPVRARRSQPPFDSSAMDGYAVRATDVVTTPVSLKVIGVSAAGHASPETVRAGEAVRIFTGAPLPKGADAIVIQENVAIQSQPYISVQAGAAAGQHIRTLGLDFMRGDRLIAQGTRLNARDIGLAAAANAAEVEVRRRPLVAILATGDELVEPGRKPRKDQIISSNSLALAAMVQQFGGESWDLGIVPDRLKATERAIERARRADILLTTGGASVGDHDLVQEALRNAGVRMSFWKIAMRPGKPVMYGRRQGQHVLGLPGNPVSALVTARLFLKPLLSAMLGLPADEPETLARLTTPMKANDSRQDYVRATLEVSPDGSRMVTPFARQDSSMQRTLCESQALIVRPPHAVEARAGDLVPVLLLDF